MAMRDRETAIATALGYLGQDAKGLWVESAIWMPASGDDEMLDQLRNVLERDLDDFEMRLACQHNRDKWMIQFVSIKTDHGDTPQGPCVFVFDDGEVSHYRPM
jgi:hypothetical protein